MKILTLNALCKYPTAARGDHFAQRSIGAQFKFQMLSTRLLVCHLPLADTWPLGSNYIIKLTASAAARSRLSN